jgi:4-amino-4-deoxy-L-arabinose transferase-like glycosyltransferase
LRYSPAAAPAVRAVSSLRSLSVLLAADKSLARSAAAAIGLALLLLLPGIGAGYSGRDEAEYAGVAHAMNATGDYLVPRLFGRIYPDKPPLSEWLTAASFRVFGQSEATGRLPHVLLAAGTVALLLRLGARLLDRRRGLIASLLFSTSLLFIVYGRLLLTDSDLLFFTLAAILGLLSILEGDPSAAAVFAAGAALGLATLAKGPVALLAPGLFSAGYLAGPDRPAFRRLVRVALAGAVALVVALPWFLLASRATAGESLRSFLLRENLRRFASPMEGHGGPLVFFPLVLWFGFFPWSGALLFLLRRDPLVPSPARRGLLLWVAGTLIFFTFSATKLPHYILPALPAAAILAASAVPLTGQRRVRIAAWATAATGAALFAAMTFAARVTGEPGAFGLLVPFGAAAGLSVLGPLLAGAERTRRFLPALAILASAAIVVGAVPALDHLRSTDRLGLAARARRLAGEPLGGLNIREAALTYYSGAMPTELWRSADDLARAAASSPTHSILVWLDSADTVSLSRDRRLRVELLVEGPNLADPRVRDLLALCRVRSRDAAHAAG